MTQIVFLSHTGNKLLISIIASSLDRSYYGLCFSNSLVNAQNELEFNEKIPDNNLIKPFPKFLLTKIKVLKFNDSDPNRGQLPIEWMSSLDNILDLCYGYPYLATLDVSNFTELYSNPKILQKISRIDTLRALGILLVENEVLVLPPNLTSINFYGNRSYPTIAENHITNLSSSLEKMYFHSCFVHVSIIKSVPQLRNLSLSSSYLYDDYNKAKKLYNLPITIMPSLESFNFSDATDFSSLRTVEDCFITYAKGKTFKYIESDFVSNIAQQPQLSTLILDFGRSNAIIPQLRNLTKLIIKNSSKNVYPPSDAVWDLPHLTSLTANNFQITDENLKGCATLKKLKFINVIIDNVAYLKMFSRITNFEFINSKCQDQEKCDLYSSFICNLLDFDSLEIIKFDVVGLEGLFSHLIGNIFPDTEKIYPKRCIYIKCSDIVNENFLIKERFLAQFNIKLIGI
jgi:hypothetical protein